MELSRRKFNALGAGGLALLSLGVIPANANITDDEIAKIVGDLPMSEGALSITAPEIAENGNTVPIQVSAEGASSIVLFADGNPVPNVATFNFGPLNATRTASTRIRLAKSQNVVAIAKMEDGSIQKAQAAVKVTIGGCGG